MDNLAAKVKKLWQVNRGEYEAKLDDWREALMNGQKIVRRARKRFHQWNPLMAYISTAKAGSAHAVLSIRFYGQEVATLIVRDKEVKLRLKGHSKNNKKWFRCLLDDGDYDWSGKEAREFRSHLKHFASSSQGWPKVGIPEHRIESKFIQEMVKGSKKFGGLGLKIRPVTIAGFPLQFPLPIGACAGQPKKKGGHIDILARRRGKGDRTKLSVWELKQPRAYSHAASQAYIYAVTLLQILRQTNNGPEWYKLFGFKSAMPRPLGVEAVVAITRDQKAKFDKEKASLLANTPFQIDGDNISLYVAYYQEEPESIRLGRNPFSEK